MGKSKKQSVRSIAKQLAELEKAYSGSPTQVLCHDGCWVSDLGGAIVGEIPPALVLGKTQEQINLCIIEKSEAHAAGLMLYDGTKVKGPVWSMCFRGLGPQPAQIIEAGPDVNIGPAPGMN